MRPRFRGAAVVMTLTAAALSLAGPSAAQSGTSVPTDRRAVSVASTVDVEPGGEAAALVTQEDERLTQVGMADALARVSRQPFRRPYLLPTEPLPTLVLTARAPDYTWQDLRRLAGDRLRAIGPGTYRLSLHVVVLEGATLSLTGDGARTLQLLSGPTGFATIVNLGGRLQLAGTGVQRLQVTSWDPRVGSADTDPTDGRAYVRSLGGALTVTDADLSDLGFWSGRTGGLAVTGSARPASTTSESAGGAGSDEGTAAGAVIEQLVRRGRLDAATAYGSQAPGAATASLTRTTVRGSTFGFFASSIQGMRVVGSRFAENTADGLVLHRYVTDAEIRRTSTVDNGNDGLVLDRHVDDVRVTDLTTRGNGHDGVALAPGATDVTLARVQALENIRNGVTMSGLPLAAGPSASGESSRTHGNNVLTGSRVVDNGRYGLELIGGTGLRLTSSQVEGQQMGVVVREGARDVTLRGNTVQGARAQGVSVRESSTDVEVVGNTISAGEISVYLRDATARVVDNTLVGATNHAVAALGRVGSSEVVDNRVSGRGPSALDTTRVTGGLVRLAGNDTATWDDTTPLEVLVKRVLQPLTVVWILIVLVLGLTALRHRRDRTGAKHHPYADKAPLPGRQLRRDEATTARTPLESTPSPEPVP